MITYVVFGIGKAGTSSGEESLDREISQQFRRTQLDLENRKPWENTQTFFNSSEYRAFLSVSQLSDDKVLKSQCLTITVRNALERCLDCKDNATIFIKVRLIDRFANNELIQKNISACSSEPNANYAYVPLKEPATFRRASDLQSSKTPEVYPLLEERMRLGDWAQLFLVFDDIDLFQVRT